MFDSGEVLLKRYLFDVTLDSGNVGVCKGWLSGPFSHISGNGKALSVCLDIF